MSTEKRFNITDSGPFYIFLESADKNVGRLHPMSVGKMPHNLIPSLKDRLIDTKLSGMNRIRLELNSVLSANSLLNKSILKENNLIDYIPNFLLYKHRVIKGVDTSIDGEEILSFNVISKNTEGTKNF